LKRRVWSWRGSGVGWLSTHGSFLLADGTRIEKALGSIGIRAATTLRKTKKIKTPVH
jgi:hypothetical protein